MKQLAPLVTFIAVLGLTPIMAQTTVSPSGPTATTPPSTVHPASPSGPTVNAPPVNSTGPGATSGVGNGAGSNAAGAPGQFNPTHPGGPSGSGTVYPNYTRPGGSVGGTNG
jgi:hypothetical protein